MSSNQKAAAFVPCRTDKLESEASLLTLIPHVGFGSAHPLRPLWSSATPSRVPQTRVRTQTSHLEYPSLTPIALWVPLPFGSHNPLGPTALWVPLPFGSRCPSGPTALWVPQPFGSRCPSGPTALRVPQTFGSHSSLGPTATECISNVLKYSCVKTWLPRWHCSQVKDAC